MQEELKHIAQEFLIDASSGKVKQAYDKYVAIGFKHHNIYFKGDAYSLQKGMEENAAQFPEKKYTVKHVIAEDNFVVVHGHATLIPGEPGYSLVHIFRFENEKIIELWDIAQQIPENIINEFGAF